MTSGINVKRREEPGPVQIARRPLNIDMPVTDAGRFVGTDPVLNRIPAVLFTDDHDRRCAEKHGKGLRKIAEDGGMTAVEIVSILAGTNDAPGRAIGSWEAHRVLRSIVEGFRRGYRIGTGID